MSTVLVIFVFLIIHMRQVKESVEQRIRNNTLYSEQEKISNTIGLVQKEFISIGTFDATMPICNVSDSIWTHLTHSI